MYVLDNYPFDKQTCSIDIRTSDLDSSTLKLLPKKLWMEQSVDMTLFLMEHWELVYKNESAPEEGVSMTIVLRRKILSEMMGTYLPSILLMMITFATTFFKPYFFEAALTVNLTNMLVMTTIFTSVMEKLPPTSDMKMLDIWLIFCLIVPFLEVILRTSIECTNCSCDICEEDKNNGGEVASVWVGTGVKVAPQQVVKCSCW